GLTQEQEADLVAFMIRECLATGVTSRIAFLDPLSPAQAKRTALAPRALAQASRPARVPSESQGEATTVTRATRQGGRNMRCPCGSGRKYKACCGRS
ncbi:MAG TPA: SEC-C metal-binding domain-containing protein, partial [Isosphaeraceae bacterium]|nr:SEC-C metal-binding domain-containing protein [Isosphaeraceae bacterium]